MTSKTDSRRAESSTRKVELRVGGAMVELNGYVQDVFQETILALVRTLGTEDASQAVELTIGAETPAGR